MTNNIFQEPELGFVSHTAGSSLLVAQKGVRDWVDYTTTQTFPSSSKLVEATEKWGASDVPGQTAYNFAFDTPLPVFQHMAQFAERVAGFANAMIEFSTTNEYSVRHLVNGFDWESLEHGSHVVDVCSNHLGLLARY
jgi:6-hydroxytryprostatin B O-methyltransferase